MTPSLLILWLSHVVVDFCVGIWPMYKTVMGIDIVHASLIAGIGGFIGEGMQLLFGYFCDRGRRKLVLIVGVMLATSILLLPLATTLKGCFFCVLFLMLGSGAFHPAALGFASALGEKNKGKSILLFASGGALGYSASQLIFSHAHSHAQGTSLAWWFILPAVIILVLAGHRFTGVVPSRSGLDLASFLVPFKQNKKALVLLYVSQIANQCLFLSVVFLLPDLMREQNCHSWLCKGGGHLCMILGGGVAMIPAGYLADRFGHRKVMLVTVAVCAVSLYTLLFYPASSLMTTAIFLILFGSSLGVVNPMIIAWGNALVPESPSFVSALLGGMAWCFGHLGTIAVGLLAGSFAMQACVSAIGVMGFVLVLNFFFILSIPAAPKKVEKKTILTD